MFKFKKEKPPKPMTQKRKRSGKKMIAIVLCGSIVLAYFGYNRFVKTPVTAQAQTAVVTRGDVSKIIEGSGTIAAIDQYNVTALVKGEILSDYFEEGQMIRKDDLMYRIDTTDINNSIEKSVASLEKAQLSYNQSKKVIEDMTIRAPVSGVITSFLIENGDNIQSGAKVAEIINTDTMLLKITFNADDAKQILVGESATVKMENSFTTLYGSVTRIATGAIVSADGVLVTTVEIMVDNPGGIISGSRGTAIVGDYACNAPGTFEYMQKATVLAQTSGKARGAAYKEGDYIKKGSLLVNLENDSTDNNVRQSELSLKDAQLSLENLYDQINNYNITAPISGKVIQKNSKAGDKIDNANSNTVMAIIADLSTLTFNISVDELDIRSIKVGQQVEVTADAVSGAAFLGYVDNISIVGTSSNGVTSYPVKVVINEGVGEGLIPGMNVNAKIVIESKKDVLRVPISAINRGNIVIVKTDGFIGGDKENDFVRPLENGQNSAEPSGNRTYPNGVTGQITDAQGAADSYGQRQSVQGEADLNGQRPSVQGAEGQEGQRQGRRIEGAEGQIPQAGYAQRSSQNATGQVAAPTATAMPKVSAAPNTSSAPSASLTGAMPVIDLERLAANLKVPDGFKVVRVEVGLSDSDYVEIVSGLSEGDVVLLPDKTTAAASPNVMVGMPGGGTMPTGGGGTIQRGGSFPGGR